MKRAVIFLFLLSLTFSAYGASIEATLKHISLDEKIKMRKFFDYSLCLDQLGHVLFFETKPVCLTGFLLKGQKPFIEVMSRKGWYCFKKNETLFPHPRYLIQERIVECDKDFTAYHIYIINKQALIKCLNEHVELFRVRLGTDFTSEQFMSRLEEGENLSCLIQENDELLGVLLGFGEESAKAFKTVNEKKDDFYCSKWTDDYCGIDVSKPKGCKLFPVGFMGNPNSTEVQHLVATYEQELKEIWNVYRQSKDPLLMVLEKFCTP